ncbi:uncharacterized protein LOC110083155 [Pogona vitticeps]
MEKRIRSIVYPIKPLDLLRNRGRGSWIIQKCEREQAAPLLESLTDRFFFFKHKGSLTAEGEESVEPLLHPESQQMLFFFYSALCSVHLALNPKPIYKAAVVAQVGGTISDSPFHRCFIQTQHRIHEKLQTSQKRNSRSNPGNIFTENQSNYSLSKTVVQLPGTELDLMYYNQTSLT